MSATLVWFRQDLRLSDHPALRAAIERDKPVIPVYIWSESEEGQWAAGGASRWWLHHSLLALAESLKQIDSELILRSGPAQDELEKLIKQTDADAVYWNRRYEPEIIERDTEVKNALKANDIEVRSFNGSLLIEPWEIKTKAGDPYQVFSPFWKQCLELDNFEEPLPRPRKIPTPKSFPQSEELTDWELEPKIKWAEQMREFWKPGEKQAQQMLKHFLEQAVEQYKDDRNRPDLDGTSRLSPYLHFGEISPREIYHEVKQMQGRKPKANKKTDPDVFISEVGWREFAYHLLYHFPETTTQPLRQKFADFNWDTNSSALSKWQKGQTGYPIVDAGMRQLWAIGWMHNRVRMIVASFLTKDLFIHWNEGAAWFWDTLVDADLANNTLGWQWTAGCGADAAPYFRIFNPVSQAERYDPEGEYIRQWVPELAKLDKKYIHKPWEAPDHVLKDAGIRLGTDYPKPIVDHAEQRKDALSRFEKVK